MSRRLRLLVRPDRVAVRDERVRVRLELGDEARHRPRQEGVVRAQPAQDLARRVPEAGVQRVDLAAVGLAAPPGEPVGIAPDDLDAPVRRAAVDDEVLDRLVVLREHGLDRLGEELRLVVGRRDDADERPAHLSQGSDTSRTNSLSLTRVAGLATLLRLG
jgi:hypothetical protein